MYADELMKLAAQADDTADDYISRMSGLIIPTATDIELTERATFYRGQASGFRQSAYYMAVQEGTHASD